MNFETLISDFGIYLEKQGHAAITMFRPAVFFAL